MILKEKLTTLIDSINKRKLPEYDRILSCSVKGEAKGAFMTIDCSTVKQIPEKCQKGLIDIGEILDAEFENSESYHYKKIIFCDKDNVMCIYNSKNDSYYEDVHESFEPAEERLYVRCDTDASYEAVKNFVNQSSKYHNFVEYEYEIPRKDAFKMVFSKTQNSIENFKGNNLMIEKNNNYLEKMER